MKIIIGLGNPGEKYKKTRHNFGFMAVDFLREKLGAPDFKLNKWCNAEISKTQKIILVKPQTFMNNSGEAAIKLLSFFKIKPEDLSVVHDDLDLDFGKIKIGAGRGSAGHNGVQSIIDRLGTNNFNRIRLGIGRPHSAEAPRGEPHSARPSHPPSPILRTRLRNGAAKATEGHGEAPRGEPPLHIPPEDFVLQNFSPEESKQLPDIFKKISV